MNNIVDFLNDITKEYESIEEKAICALKARGFLIDQRTDGHYYLSDNVHADDVSYLREKLSELSIGEYSSDSMGIYRIVIYSDVDIDKLCLIFSYDDLGGGGANSNGTWNEFIKRKHGEKYEVRKMEPFIAYYAKAISSCGVKTGDSCDGNYDYMHHTHGGKLYVKSHDPYRLWHKLIWDNIVIPKFGELPFIEDKIAFKRTNQFSLYKKIFDIADCLYNNRILIREIKETACKKIGRSKSRRYTSKNKTQEQINRNEMLLEKLFIENCDFSLFTAR